jgi:chromosomal replication initiator protein
MTLSPKVWGDALRSLQNEIPEFAFDAWIRPLAVRINRDDVVGHDAAGHIVLGCPTSFHRDRVRTNFAETIRRCWQSACQANGLEDDGRGTTSFEFVTMNDFATSRGTQIEVRLPPRRELIVHDSVHRSMRKIAAPALSNTRARAQNDGGPLSVVHASHASTLDHGAGPALEGGFAGRVDSSALIVSPASGKASASKTSSAANESFARSPSGEPAIVALQAVRDRKRRAPACSGSKGAGARALGDSTVKTHSRTESDPSANQAELPFSFESFVVGPCNALAREAALALARRRQRSLNQLYLSGGSGMGKTHLARATAAEARRHGRQLEEPFSFSNPARHGDTRGGNSAYTNANAPHGQRGQTPRVIYTSAEQFTSEFVTAMRQGRPEDWKRRYRGSIGLLIVEDVQLFSGRTKTQLELFNTIEHVLDAGGSVLLTGDRAPRDLVGLDERMRAQVGRGFVAELEMPDALIRRHILRSKAAGGGVHLPPDCLDLLVESTAGSVRDIESMLIQVVTTSSLLGRTIDLELVQEAITLKAGETGVLDSKSLTSEEIVRIVAAFFGRRPEVLAGRSRRRDVLIPRQLAMYLAHRYTNDSFTEIGRSLGRDHPSVRNAINRIERLVLEKAPLRYQVEALSERIDQAQKALE